MLHGHDVPLRGGCRPCLRNGPMKVEGVFLAVFCPVIAWPHRFPAHRQAVLASRPWQAAQGYGFAAYGVDVSDYESAQELARRSTGRVTPPAMGGTQTPLGDAPGTYVAMR